MHNVIWFFGNIIGDKTPDFYNAVLEGTDFVAYLGRLITQP